MSILYDLIIEIKLDLNQDEQLRIEINSESGSVIRPNDKLKCFDGILVIDRNNMETLIPLNKIMRVRREKRNANIL